MLLRPINAVPSNSMIIPYAQTTTFSTIIEGASSVVTRYMAHFYDGDTLDLMYGHGSPCRPALTAGQTLSFDVTPGGVHDLELLEGKNYFWTLDLFQKEPDIFITKATVRAGSTQSDVIIKHNPAIQHNMFLDINGERRRFSTYAVNKLTQDATCRMETPFTGAVTAQTPCTVYSDFVTSVQFPFCVKRRPTLSIQAPDISEETVKTRSVRFDMDYSALSTSPVKWYQITVRDYYTGEIFATSGQQYNSSLTYTFTGFLDGGKYSVSGEVFNTDNTLISTTTNVVISVSYDSPSMELAPSIDIVPEDDSIRLQWQADMYSEAKSDEPAWGWGQTLDDMMVVDAGVVYYDDLSGDPLYLRDEWSVFTDARISNKIQGNIISVDRDLGTHTKRYRVYVDNNSLYYQIEGGMPVFLKQLLDTEQSGQLNTNTGLPGVAYIWDDTEVWSDIKYWVETLSFQRRYKITLLSDKAIVKEVT